VGISRACRWSAAATTRGPQPKPLTAAALKALQKKAEDMARENAQVAIDVISAYKCPSSTNPKKNCKNKRDLASNFFDDPYCVGPPRTRLENFEFKFPGPMAIIVRVEWQVWVQYAEQKHHVEFDCIIPGTG
jgi:hypothetical protein